jgi:hypothetical protein
MKEIPAMMKQLIAGALLAGALATAGFAQADKQKLMRANPQSPASEADLTINGKQIWIAYHAPSMRGRHIFGGEGALQPDGSVWRAGADFATVMHTDAALDIGGVSVPPGDYSLYVDLDKGKWQLIVNKKVGQWGINRDGSTSLDPTQNVGKAAMTISKPPSPIETYKMTLTETGSGKGKLQLEWENVIASVNFTGQ